MGCWKPMRKKLSILGLYRLYIIPEKGTLCSKDITQGIKSCSPKHLYLRPADASCAGPHKVLYITKFFPDRTMINIFHILY
jgi:hypothetical protein